MHSRIAEALHTRFGPLAIVVAAEKPAGAREFTPHKWGCVMMAVCGVAQTGKPHAFSRQTYGCWGGGVGLGFGNCYEQFPGGLEGFAGFLSEGNHQSQRMRKIADDCAAWMKGSLREEFLHGERYRKSAEIVDEWTRLLPMTDVGANYIVIKPLADLGGDETPVSVVFFANADQMSALVVLANYGRADGNGAIIPHAAGCQSIGILTYNEAKSDQPRAVVGLNDISARKYTRTLGTDLLTVSLPWRLFQEMEANVAGSFLEKETWHGLAGE